MTTLVQLLDRKGHAIHSIEPGAAVIDAIRMMAERHVGALLVMEKEQLAGIVSERDYARKITLLGRSSTTTAVQEIMSAPVVTAAPAQTIEDAMRLMTDHHIRHLPVIRGHSVVGVVSIGDLVKAVIDDQQHLIDDMRQYISG